MNIELERKVGGKWFTWEGYRMVLAYGTYAMNGSLAIECYSYDADDENLYLEVWDSLTTNLPVSERGNRQFLNAHDYTHAAEILAAAGGIGKPTSESYGCGYLTFPLYEFDLERLREIGVPFDD